MISATYNQPLFDRPRMAAAQATSTAKFIPKKNVVQLKPMNLTDRGAPESDLRINQDL